VRKVDKNSSEIPQKMKDQSGTLSEVSIIQKNENQMAHHVFSEEDNGITIHGLLLCKGGDDTTEV
jgi:hypothetical protein